MKTISLLRLALLNFKGIRKLEVDFSKVTFIHGENATGKTTVFDAFLWLLFDKDSSDKKDFNIKTLDKLNQPIPKIDHEVSAVLTCDGAEILLKKVYREKWVKEKGAERAEFKGHETLYYYNDVPLQKKEYQAKVDALMDENVAKMITNPLYFNSIKWQDRRVILGMIAGNLTDAEIAAGNPEFEKLVALLSNKSLLEYRREVAARKKKIKEDLSSIPTRIDEANRSMPKEEDYAGLQTSLEINMGELKKIDEEIENAGNVYQAEYNRIRQMQDNKLILEGQLRALQSNREGVKQNRINEIERDIRTVNNNISALEQERSNNNGKVDRNKKEMEQLEKDMEVLRQTWTKINEEVLTIDPEKFTCPACKRELEKGNIDEITANLTTNFNNDKQKRLKDITTKGGDKKLRVSELKSANDALALINDDIQKKIDKANFDLADYERMLQLASQTKSEKSAEEVALEQKIAGIIIPTIPAANTSEAKAKKAGIQNEIDSIRIKLAGKDQIAKIKARITELSNEERELAQQLATLEKSEFTMDAFSKAKVEAIEQRINGKFKLVKFKMYDQQINGGEVECCECMVNGVPYSDVNTASKINAGLDIINALSEHYGLAAPVFIDNRESINDLIPCRSQIINLVVSRDKALKVTQAPEAIEAIA